MATATEFSSPEVPTTAARVDRRSEYRCECGKILPMFGRGRHRVYFQSASERMDDPVMNGVCPACGRGLPGKKPS